MNKDNLDLFNMNKLLNKIIAFGAQITLIGSIMVLSYLSFIETFDIVIDWTTIGIFSGATVMLSWTCWNMFYRKQFERMMTDDILQISKGQYSVHGRYYNSHKDWTESSLQMAIDNFNKEYTKRWLRWVEAKTGVPIETIKQKVTDKETGEASVITTLGILDLPYRRFKYKHLMWRVKNHKYPESGYRSALELLSLFSYQDSDLSRRNIKADRGFYFSKSFSKIFTSILVIVTGASLVPEMINGDVWSALLKLALAIGALISSVFGGAMSGVRGARIKLSIVEDACSDLERWNNTKPKITPYNEVIEIKDAEEKVEEMERVSETEEPEKDDIFSRLKIQKK